MIRYKLRTLLILLAWLPPILAVVAPPLVQWFKTKTAGDMPVARVYPLSNADPAEAARLVKAALPGSTIAIDSQSASLLVSCQPADQAAVVAVIKELEQGQPRSMTAELRRFEIKPAPAAAARP